MARPEQARCIARRDPANQFISPTGCRTGRCVSPAIVTAGGGCIGCEPAGAVIPVLSDPPEQTEFGRPEWVFGTATWASASANTLVTAFTRDGRWHLGAIDFRTGTLRDLASGLEPLEWLTTTPERAILVAASPTTPDAVVQVDLASGAAAILRSSASTHSPAGTALDAVSVSVPTRLRVPLPMARRPMRSTTRRAMR